MITFNWVVVNLLSKRNNKVFLFHGRLLHPRCDLELVFMAGGALDQLELGIWSDQLARTLAAALLIVIPYFIMDYIGVIYTSEDEIVMQLQNSFIALLIKCRGRREKR